MTNPDGLCLCGCGQKTNIANRTRKTHGHIKGQSLDYVHGHKKGTNKWGDRPLPLCGCGCGNQVVLATTSSKKRKSVAGMPNKFIHGHSSFRTTFEERNAPLPLCACGCGKRVALRKSKVLRGHHMKLVFPGTKTDDRGFGTPCEIWQGHIDTLGYGRYEAWDGGKRSPTGTVLRHRQVWISANGEIPEGMDVHHQCEQRDCCNVAHLELKSKAEHLRSHRGISPEKYAEIIAALRTAQESQAGIARRFGVSKVFIWKLKKDLSAAVERRHE